MSEFRRVAFLHPGSGPITGRDWSGTPLGLTTAMRSLGIEVVEIGYDVPSLVRRAAHALSLAGGGGPAAAERSAIKRVLRRGSHQRQLDDAGALDAVIAVGTDAYPLGALRLGVPVATYDDTTLATMWANEESDTRTSGHRSRRVERWIRAQRASSRAATVNCVSTAWAGRSFVSDYDIEAVRVHVVGMGHRPRRETAVVDRDWSDPVFLFVGVDWRRKNGQAVLRAFRDVRELHPRATLHLVGAHAAIREAGVVDHGTLARDDPQAQALLDALYASATAFVLPSRFDPSPIAYLEAASAGLPVVATTEGGAGEMLGDAAITVSPFDHAQIRDAMLALADPDEARRRGTLAQERAREATWEHVVRRILSALGSEASVGGPRGVSARR